MPLWYVLKFKSSSLFSKRKKKIKSKKKQKPDQKHNGGFAKKRQIQKYTNSKRGKFNSCFADFVFVFAKISICIIFKNSKPKSKQNRKKKLDLNSGGQYWFCWISLVVGSLKSKYFEKRSKNRKDVNLLKLCMIVRRRWPRIHKFDG